MKRSTCWILAVLALLAGGSAGAAGLDVAPSQPALEDEPPTASLPPLYPRSSYAWPLSAGPDYGRLPERKDPSGMLHTWVGSFDLTGDAFARVPRALRYEGEKALPSIGYWIVQLRLLPENPEAGTRVREDVRRDGGRVVGNLPVAAFVARLSGEAAEALARAPEVLRVERYHPALKLAPWLGRTPLPDPVQAVSEEYDLDVVVFPEEDSHLVAAEIARVGGKVTEERPDVVRATLHRSRLQELAAVESVRSIEEHLPVYLQGEETTATVQTGAWRHGSLPYHAAGITGSGNGLPGTTSEILMILDDGIQLDAGDLSNTRTIPGVVGPAHRKVVAYLTTAAFGGVGDLMGCDSSVNGAFTHGHALAATALGNATRTPPAYGAPWLGTDRNGNTWALDGVAPGARLAFYDAQVTVAPLCNAGLTIGDLYTAPAAGSLAAASLGPGADVFGLPWAFFGAGYGVAAVDVDAFMFDYPESLVFLAAGNFGSAGVFNPASAKSALVVGATGNANDWLPDGGNQDDRASFSSIGPATAASGRIAPILMAPGTDFLREGDNLGLDSETYCRSTDDTQGAPVECDVARGFSGTSTASAAAAGAALLVRDYFQQGFHPDGTSTNPGNAADQEFAVSGALVKSVLVASADWVGKGTDPGRNLSVPYRFNNEQGYGRVQLSNALPLVSDPTTPSRLVVADGAIPAGVFDLPLGGAVAPGGFDAAFFTVCDAEQDLRAAVSWIEAAGEFLANDLQLELLSPTGVLYWGNVFTEDTDRDGILDPAEDCDGDGAMDASPWSLPVCVGSAFDSANPTEGVFLSPDPLGNGIRDDPATALDESADNPIELGVWTVFVDGAPPNPGVQPYALAMVGGICELGSWTEIAPGDLTCNSFPAVRVQEVDDPGGDPAAGLVPAEISARTVVQVVQGTGGAEVVVDSEAGFAFAALPALHFETAPLPLTGDMAAVPGDGVLQVRDGQRVRVVYQDEVGGVPAPDQRRVSVAPVHCRPRVRHGSVVWARFGRDSSSMVEGGCEKDARGLFTHGYPDRYMDAGERIVYSVAFQSAEDQRDLLEGLVSLRCVLADADSPATCIPGANETCADPRRQNNLPCTQLTILDSPRLLPQVSALHAATVSFSIQMAGVITGTPVVDMLLEVTSRNTGEPLSALLVQRHTLNADELWFNYSTDFPGGGVEIRDWDDDEVVDAVNVAPGNVDLDYRFDAITWSDLTAGGTRNMMIGSPWDFDLAAGGFQSGVGKLTTPALIAAPPVANWGEDLDFDGVLDPAEDRDPVNALLDSSWGLAGGCGWQTEDPGPPLGGVWHTGTIGPAGALPCTFVGPGPGACELFDTVPGFTGQNAWHELLLTPELQKVNVCTPPLPANCAGRADAPGDPVFRVELMDWAWNMSLDLPDSNVALTWEFDNDTSTRSPSDLIADGDVLGTLNGPYGAVGSDGNPDLTDGFPMFSPLTPAGFAVNGVVGLNRVGDSSCFFEGPGVSTGPFDLARPQDDDVDDDGDGPVDEFVVTSGPIRNMSITKAGGPDLREELLEDRYGDTGETFRAALGLLNREGNGAPASPGFGASIDDMVIQWREVRLDLDATSCFAGVCATISVAGSISYDGRYRADISVLETSPSINDCNGDGDFVDVGVDDLDCNDNGITDVVVVASSDADPVERVILDTVSPGSGVYRGSIPVSTAYDSPGYLFAVHRGNAPAVVRVRYQDRDDGTGAPCGNNSAPSLSGMVQATTTLDLVAGEVVVVGYTLLDNGDFDAWPDTNETVNMNINLSNKTGIPLSDVVVRLESDDPKIDCVSIPQVTIGTIPAGGTAATPSPFQFRVAGVSRVAVNDDFSARFRVTISAAELETTIQPQELVLDLDLNAAGGLIPGTYTEGFEGAGFGSFTSVTLDAGIASNALSDGRRCQYNDPDRPGSLSFGRSDCFLGFTTPANNAYDWHVHGAASPDGGRAFLGASSLHYGVHPGGGPAFDTTRLGQLDGVRTTNPINLAVAGAPSDLSFKHQVSFVDSRTTTTPEGEAVDRGYVEVQIASSSGAAVGSWIKIYPYQNLYDAQGTAAFSECSFDPTDDGNDEDSFYDPGDPGRQTGPSSSCFPEFVFASQGNTAFNAVFDVGDLGRASDGPGLDGSVGPGTWVESRFRLDRFRGRRIRIRFVASTLKVGEQVIYNDLFFLGAGDDGWYIDDVTVTNTLASAVALSVDGAPNAGFPACPACALVVDALAAAPAALPAPGSRVVLSAAGSTAGPTCPDGLLEYQFAIDNNANGVIDVADTLLRDWTDDPILIQAPLVTTTYLVDARCSSTPACTAILDAAGVTVTVACPIVGSPQKVFFPAPVAFSNKTTLGWGSSQNVDVVRGNLAAVRSTGSFTGTVLACLANNASLPSITDAVNPAVGGVFYYVVRPIVFCNQASTWTTGHPREALDRDAELAADPAVCP